MKTKEGELFLRTFKHTRQGIANLRRVLSDLSEAVASAPNADQKLLGNMASLDEKIRVAETAMAQALTLLESFGPTES